MNPFSVFTTALVTNGQIQHLDDHLLRLRQHATHFGIPYPGDPFVIASEARQSRSCTKSFTKTSENFPNVGRGLDRFTVVRDDEKPRLIRISLSRDGFSFTTRALTPPASGPIIITDIQVDPRFKHFKTSERDPYDRAAALAKTAGALEALVIDEEGYVVDGTRSSPLLLRDNVLISLEGGLRGITREHVLRHAQTQGIEVRRAKLKPADLEGGMLLVAGSGIGLRHGEINGMAMSRPSTGTTTKGSSGKLYESRVFPTETTILSKVLFLCERGTNPGTLSALAHPADSLNGSDSVAK